jgi:hypothetical protein
VAGRYRRDRQGARLAIEPCHAAEPVLKRFSQFGDGKRGMHR